MKTHQTWTIYYKRIGAANYAWVRCLPVLSVPKARALVAALHRAGYAALYAPTED